MNVVEREKMEWMKEVPLYAEDNSDGVNFPIIHSLLSGVKVIIIITYSFTFFPYPLRSRGMCASLWRDW